MHWSRCSEVVHVYIYNVFLQIICRLYPYGYVERIFVCHKDSKFIWANEPYENLISLVQRWHHTFQHFWSHFYVCFQVPWKARETAMADQQKHLDWRFVHFTEDLSAFAPFSHSKKHLQLHWGSSISKYWVYSLYGVLMCFGAGSHLLYNTDRTQPKTNESTPCMIHVQRSSSCALSKWSNEWRAHGSRSQATWAEAWFRVILCSVGEKPRLFVWDIMCDSHSSGAERCGACRACSPCNAAEIWRTDPQQ